MRTNEMNSPSISGPAWCPLGVVALVFALGLLTGCKQEQNTFVA